MIDAHVHLWDPEVLTYEWLEGTPVRRPMLPEQQDMYPGTAYYDLLPGITGPWQVSARNETTFAARAYFDTRYARTLSFMEDLRMLASTVRVVTRATGH